MEWQHDKQSSRNTITTTTGTVQYTHGHAPYIHTHKPFEVSEVTTTPPPPPAYQMLCYTYTAGATDCLQARTVLRTRYTSPPRRLSPTPSQSVWLLQQYNLIRFLPSPQPQPHIHHFHQQTTILLSFISCIPHVFKNLCVGHSLFCRGVN